MKHMITTMVLMGILTLGGVAGAETVNLQASKDNTLYFSDAGTLSNGEGSNLFVGAVASRNNNEARRAVIAFDIAGNIPVGSTIESVTLTLNMSRTNIGDKNISVHRLLAAWGEGTSNAPGGEGGGTTATAGDATWLHTFSPTDSWQSPGGDFVVTASGSATVGGSGSYTWGTTPEMVADVQGWLDTPSENFGWILIGPEDSQSAKRFDSRENGDSNVRPVLVVEYTGPQGNVPLEDPIPETISKGSSQIDLETVATGLTAPNWGTFAPGDTDSLFVSDQTGALWKINLASGEKTLFHDVSGRLVELGIVGPGTFDERGLLGVAFHPDYATNGLLYTYTSEPTTGTADFSTMPPGSEPDHQSVIAEWRVSSPGDPGSTVDPGSARILLRIDEPQFNHNGGALGFGSDGMLHVAFGDGGGADDKDGQISLGSPMVGHGENGNGQDGSNVLGTILRIDPTGSNSVNGQYGIPADNPFVGQSGFVEEIFAYGFRNPFRFSFDSATGALYVGDVGQNDIEEIDLVSAGGNYGWNLKEGTFFFDPNGDDPGFVTNVDPGITETLTDPIAQYDHDEGLAIIGGFVYRGTDTSSLSGKYVFGDFAQTFNNDGRLFYLDGNEIKEFELAGGGTLGLSLLGFGQDANGEIYVLANATGTPSGETGVVLKMIAADDGRGGVEEGYLVTRELWIKAVINSEEKGPIEAVWQKGGEDTTSAGDLVIWGHFYASPDDVTWGSQDNPDLFVKIWFDHGGRLDVNFFHVSVPDIEVFSDFPFDETTDEQGTTTLLRRYIRQFYENGVSQSDENFEDGNPPAGLPATGNPSGNSSANDLRIGAIINTVEMGGIEAIWRLGGQDTTARGDEVVWGHFYASPTDVTWGSANNPDLFVKIWFDVGGRVDVNFFHVSVPDIEIYSDFPSDGTYDQAGTTTLDNRYIIQQYQR